MILIDSHCHLEYDVFKEDFSEILARAETNGIKLMQTISTKVTEFEKLKYLIETYNQIYASIGIHPHEVDTHPETSVEDLLEFTKHPKVIGIGETGLDLYYKHSDIEKQKEYFLRHIEASHQSKLPLIIHTRDADDLTIDMLKNFSKSFTGLIHCFSSESLDFARSCLDLGLFISISGIVTFKKSNILKDIVKYIPLENLIIETDSPYLAPEPYRGKRNEPSYVKKVAEMIAELKAVSLEEVADKTTENFFKLFNKAKRI
ncbi:MAG: TatD family hydrolase [Pseudomonadota bacterium]